jgi:hypothetical protein
LQRERQGSEKGFDVAHIGFWWLVFGDWFLV